MNTATDAISAQIQTGRAPPPASATPPLPVAGSSLGALFLGSGLLSGVGVVVLGLGANVATAVAGAAIAGAAQAMFMTLAFTFIQSVVPDEIRGRVMSLAALFAGGVMAIMILANGTASDVISVRILLIGPAVLFIALLIAWSLGARDLQALYRRGTLLQVAPPMHSAAG